jgi:hypothetical protein
MTTPQQSKAWLSLEVRAADQDTGEVAWSLSLPAEVWIALYRSLHTLGRRATVQVTWLGMALARQQLLFTVQGALHSAETEERNGHVIHETLRVPETYQNVDRAFDKLYNAMQAQWHDEAEIVLDATYQLLKGGRLDHFGAARVAQALLGTPVTATAWRLRVARWARKKGLPPVALHRQRRVTADSEHVKAFISEEK